jgi:hypothetical protein
VDHPCHQCNASVEEGVPFCPRCGAPQIRVTMPEGNEPVTGPMPPGTPGDLQPPATPVFGKSGWQSAIPAPGGVQWRAATPGAALAGVAAGVLAVVPYVSALMIFWFFFAGGIAVLFYRRRTGEAVGAKMGAKIGALTGLFAFLLTAVANAAKLVINPNSMREDLKMSMAISLKNADPQSAKMMTTMYDYFMTASGLWVFLVLLLGMLFVFEMILTSGGGAALAAMSKRHNRL